MYITGNTILDILVLAFIPALIGGSFAFTINPDSENKYEKAFFVLTLFIVPILATLSSYYTSFVYPSYGKIACFIVPGLLFYARLLIDEHAAKSKLVDRYIAFILVSSFVLPIIILFVNIILNFYYVSTSTERVNDIRIEMEFINEKIRIKSDSLSLISLEFQERNAKLNELNKILEISEQQAKAFLKQINN